MRPLARPIACLALLIVASTAMGATVSACGTTIVPIKEPENCKLQVVDMTVLASPRLNPTVLGDPRPVQLRIYQLATDVRLNNANFVDVWKDDKKTLREDIIKMEELSIYPDSRTDIKFERDERALFVAAVALFRNPKGRSWWTIFELPPAPGKGNCSLLRCDGGICGDGGRPGPDLTPRYAVWIDGTRVDNGDDHMDEYPESGRVRTVHLPFSAPRAPGSPGQEL